MLCHSRTLLPYTCMPPRACVHACCPLPPRLPVDLEGVEVLLRLTGPVRAERREASWMLPRLLPTEAAQHSFKVTPTG